jgi:transketolase
MPTVPAAASDRDLCNAIRALAMDAVQKANSGHPGMPMGMADVAAVLWLKHLNHCPTQPDWADRDRFVLSAGHGSMLLYSLLHLAGYALPLAELQAFRQWGSKTPGHPEVGHTPGVETTTGPLGQGIANAVGMALAERMLAERFNTPGYTPVDHHTYVICGDGCMMEGISHEACSLAGHLKLNRLILFYDSNHITIEGATDLAYSDDVKRRFLGYNWRVIEVDAHDSDAVDAVIRRAKRETEKPVLIVCRSHIGMGSPNKHDTAAAHGEPLGDAEVALAKRAMGLPENELFHVPQRVRELFAERLGVLQRRARKWQRQFKTYAAAQPEQAAQWANFFDARVPADLERFLPVFPADKPVATRVAGGIVMNALAAAVPSLVGGSADLAPSTRTLLTGAAAVAPGHYAGRNLHFGVREHAMCAVMNGMLLHGGLRVFGATFFVFVDYCRPAVRLAALMDLPAIYVFTHDSFYVGEDGPTHEPVEQLASLRCMPNMTTIRPADATETGAAWVAALRCTHGPTALLLTRQNVAVLDRNLYPPASNLEKGAYTLWQSAPGEPEVLLIASGSEVELALAAAQQLAADCRVRVVSMPCWEWFERQPPAYRAETIPPACPVKVAIEAGASMGWERYVGSDGLIVGLDRFGASAPYKVLAEQFGFTAPSVVTAVRAARAARAGRG